MGMRAVEQGDTGRHVAGEVRRLRQVRRMTLQQVSDALAEVGRPLLPSGISKVEDGSRRVDVDDLAAFAEVFGVSPNQLMGWQGPALMRSASTLGTGEGRFDSFVPKYVRGDMLMPAESAGDDA